MSAESLPWPQEPSRPELPPFFAMGDFVVIGPGVAGQLASVIQRASAYGVQLGRPPLAIHLLNLANLLNGHASANGSAEVPFWRNGLPSNHAPVLDPVSAEEAARTLRCSESNVRQRLRRGTLAGQRIRGQWWIDRSTLADELRRRQSGAQSR